MLNEQRRKQLDDIVGQMVTNRESDDTVQFVVDDFKQKYENEQVAEQPKQQSTLSKIGSFAKDLGKETLRSFAQTGARLATTFSPTAKTVDPTGVLAKSFLPEKINTPMGEVAIRKQDTLTGEIGASLEDVSNAFLGGGISSVAKASFKNLMKQAFKTGAKEGTIVGATGLSGRELQESGDIGKSLQQAVVGGLTGMAFGGGLGLLSGVGGKTANYLFGKEVSKINNPQKLLSETEKLIKENPEIQQSITGKIAGEAEDLAPKISIAEKWNGIRPDIKKRIQGKTDQLKTYFNIAHARNVDDLMPTPLEFAGQKVELAGNAISDIINDTGSSIGKFREKISTIKVPQANLNDIVSVFDKELSKLNLVTDAFGDIIQQSGKATKVKAGGMNVLQTLRENLLKLKASPTIENLIDNRLVFDDQINFAKSAKEISNIADNLSRQVRAKIAEVNRGLIGKSESKTLAEFSNLMDVLAELQGYTQRKAGAEFLLKRVLSERGGSPRALLETIKKHTGIDLMDDAVMSQIATDIVGNISQKGLFRQEITKAGLDINSLLRVDKAGIVLAFLRRIADKAIDPEDVFIKASK